jgi:uncharacterized protein YjbI with pentapeptide repeats
VTRIIALYNWASLHGANLYGANLRLADLSGVWRFSDDAWIPGWELHDGQLWRAL